LHPLRSSPRITPLPSLGGYPQNFLSVRVLAREYFAAQELSAVKEIRPEMRQYVATINQVAVNQLRKKAYGYVDCASWAKQSSMYAMLSRAKASTPGA
jgi:hypothetical protein